VGLYAVVVVVFEADEDVLVLVVALVFTNFCKELTKYDKFDPVDEVDFCVFADSLVLYEKKQIVKRFDIGRI